VFGFGLRGFENSNWISNSQVFKAVHGPALWSAIIQVSAEQVLLADECHPVPPRHEMKIKF
jgi:hypothetical protein